jgi:hypothetical protein
MTSERRYWVAMKLVGLGLIVATATATAGPSAEQKEFVDKQLADVDAIRASLAADALLVLPERAMSADASTRDSDGFLVVNDIMAKDIKVGKLVAGVRSDATWIAAELTQKYALLDCPNYLPRCHRKRTLRLTELVVNGKVVTAHVDDPKHEAGTVEVTSIDPSTEPGTLSEWLTKPKALATALLDDPSVVVLGTELGERAVGPSAARKLLGRWSKLALTVAGKPREVQTKTWGYAAANIEWKTKGKTVTMRGTVFAVNIDDAWKVVAVHYSLPYHRNE